MIPAIVVFFVIFLPVYSIENFKNQDKKSREKKGDIRFSEKYKRTEWEGGNIHGKVLSKKDRPGFMEKRK